MAASQPALASGRQNSCFPHVGAASALLLSCMPRTTLNEEQVSAYRRDGYVVIDGFLSPAELEHWRRCVDDAVARRNEQLKTAKRERVPKQGSYYESVFTQRLQLWTDSADMRELMLDPCIGKMACELAGVEGIRIWHDQALIKEPWASPTAFHLDNPY